MSQSHKSQIPHDALLYFLTQNTQFLNRFSRATRLDIWMVKDYYVSLQRAKGASPDPAPVANGGFAPLCGAAATPVAALKTPVAERRGVQCPSGGSRSSMPFGRFKKFNALRATGVFRTAPSVVPSSFLPSPSGGAGGRPEGCP